MFLPMLGEDEGVQDATVSLELCEKPFAQSGVEPAALSSVAYFESIMATHNDPNSINLRTKGMIARFIGIVAIALGFVVGIYGLEDTGGPWMKTAMGLLVTGMLAQGYALYCSVRHMRDFKDQPKS